MIENLLFCAGEKRTLISALGSSAYEGEAERIEELVSIGLPPITSVPALSVMTGIHPGLLTSILKNPEENYRIFLIPKGRSFRQIESPRVILKLIQKWLSIHLQRAWKPIDCVYGFVSGRDHVDAAIRHRNAKWVFSVDIENFFPTTPANRLSAAFRRVGYSSQECEQILVPLSSFKGRLAQGAPTSPVLSNICLSSIDDTLRKLASIHSLTYTRYADDLVFSSDGNPPDGICEAVGACFSLSPWTLSEKKTLLQISPSRLKVHGIVVGNGEIKLTKGYRNKIRLYNYLRKNHSNALSNPHVVSGHLSYSRHVEAKRNIFREK